MELQVWGLRVQIPGRAQDGGRMDSEEKSRLKSRMGKIWVLGDELEIWDTWVLESEPEATFGGNVGRGHGGKNGVQAA